MHIQPKMRPLFSYQGGGGGEDGGEGGEGYQAEVQDEVYAQAAAASQVTTYKYICMYVCMHL